MRAVAAGGVVVYHSAQLMSQPEYGSMAASYAPPLIGWIGVNFFFVLSGFIICHAHAEDIGKPHRFGIYIWRRFARVYPIYWLVLLAFVAASSVLNRVDFRPDFLNIATALTLLPLDSVPDLPLKVAWTLLFEVKFYLAFAIALLSKRLGIVVALAWLFIIISHLVFPWDARRGFGESWSINFFIGGACWWLSSRISFKVAATAGVFGVAMLALLTHRGLEGGPVQVQSQGAVMVLLGLSLGALLLAGIKAGSDDSIKYPKFLMLTGDASYSIYLVHSAFISAVLIINTRLDLHIPSNLMFPLLIALSIFSGVLIHLLIERPLLSFVRRSSKTREGARLPSRA